MRLTRRKIIIYGAIFPISSIFFGRRLVVDTEERRDSVGSELTEQITARLNSANWKSYPTEYLPRDGSCYDLKHSLVNTILRPSTEFRVNKEICYSHDINFSISGVKRKVIVYDADSKFYEKLVSSSWKEAKNKNSVSNEISFFEYISLSDVLISPSIRVTGLEAVTTKESLSLKEMKEFTTNLTLSERQELASFAMRNVTGRYTIGGLINFLYS